MDTMLPASRSGNQEKQSSGNGISSPHSRLDCEREAVRNGSARIPPEKCSPPILPKSFQGMLKTTTETGDIGMFSIKPSRIPQASNSPRSNSMSYGENLQQPRHHFQPCGVPVIDDRRRLPSYAQKTTSEVIATYGSPRQIPGTQPPQDSEYRSHSMTQTSSYTLSNHRSFASLRGEQDSSALLQRPRSPFAYPTRLRRPGFRPSSPALTDGGLVDYSRRAEIERMPHSLGHKTSSPGSLYAQKRKPPCPYYQRSETNRSTPSLLSQQSPPRHSSNPNLKQSIGSQADWAQRPVSHSGNTSPACSARSLASTVNLYAAVGPASTTTTPGKLHPPSPLYYDYTEDFEIEDYKQPNLPPPAFQFNKPPPENGPTRIQTTVTNTAFDSRIPVATLQPTLRHSASVTSVLPRLCEGSTSSGKETQETTLFPYPPSNTDAGTAEKFCVESVNCKRDTKIVRLSGLGYSARELSTHVEEVFGLSSTLSFEIPIVAEFEDALENQISTNRELSFNNPGFDTMSAKSSTYSLVTDLRRFPKPPDLQGSSPRDTSNTETNVATGIIDGHGTTSIHSCHSDNSASIQRVGDGVAAEQVETVFRRISQRSQKASNDNSLDMGFEELDDLFAPPFGSVSTPKVTEEATSSRAAGSSKLTVHLPGRIATQERNTERSACTNRQSRSQNESRTCQDQRAIHEPKQPPTKIDLGSISSFDQNMPHTLMSRSELPMIAPKPISPARQLRLRNSIPQIMKALPPLPPDPPIRAGLLANRLPSLMSEHQLSPTLVNATSTPTTEPQKTPWPMPIQVGCNAKKMSREEYSSGFEARTTFADEEHPTPADIEHLPPVLSRFKLKPRASITRPLSPLDAQPWNMAESYPWSSQSVDVELPPLSSDAEAIVLVPPKFKLKVTRASTSSQGTMIVNRESNDSRNLGGLNLRSTKDLFTPAAGLDNIFRHVGRHLHTKTSESSHMSDCDPSPPATSKLGWPITIKIEDVSETQPYQQKPYVSAILVGTQSSFSDDSSHINDRRKLRTRLSNLRARIPFHYAYRNATLSSEDIVWERQSEGTRTPHIFRSAPNLHFPSATSGAGPRTKVSESVRGGKLRAKIREWLRGAKTAMIGRKRSRGSMSKRSDDDDAQLNQVK